MLAQIAIFSPGTFGRVLKRLASHQRCLSRISSSGSNGEDESRCRGNLKATGLPHLIVRPGGYFSDSWEGFEMCPSGVFLCLDNGEIRFNPISLRDLGQFVASRFPRQSNRDLTLSDRQGEEDGGSQVVPTHRKDVLEAYFRERATLRE